ncbi:MAG: GNAT family N-acetyltransferase [Desulfobacterales bacterium]|jgi:acyl-CoA hydrolase/RimJ/RimL family protein N-acetyltransferase
MKAKALKDHYKSKCKKADTAVRMIRAGQRVFIGSSCGEPQHLVRALMDNAPFFSDVEIVRLLSVEGSLLALMADEYRGHSFHLRSIYQGSDQTKGLRANKRFITPMNLCAVPDLFKKRLFPLHVALIQLSPPDDHGWMSLGISVDVTLAAAQSANLVIAQVNSKMPRVPGHGFIHLNDVDVIVEYEEELLSSYDLPEYESAPEIAGITANLVDDGSTIQLGLAELTTPIADAFADKNDLGVHTEILTDDLMALVSKGVVTNRYKGINDGKLVASGAIGSQKFYHKLHNNVALEFRPSDYVNHPAIISQNHKMIAINFARTMDLTGQVYADALPQNHFSGVTGMLDFIMGAAMSPSGKSIIVISARSIDDKISRIIPKSDVGSILVPKGYVSYVVSEFGIVNLFGKNVEERAMAMISLAHPDFRDELFSTAQESGLIDRNKSLNESLFGVYPARMEETRVYDGIEVTFRPAKPVDGRIIQEHFYAMDDKDVQTRFFSLRRSFYREDMADMFQVDYIKNLSMVAVTGEVGFEEVIGLGMYALDEGTVAEVAFSVSKEWQGKGIASLLLEKIAEAACETGITSLVAYMLATNKGMIKLFNKLPYKVETTLGEGTLILRCNFEKET